MIARQYGSNWRAIQRVLLSPEPLHRPCLDRLCQVQAPDRLVYLGYGLAAILGFIGVKLMLHALSQNNLPFIYDGQDVPVHEPSTGTSLLIIVGILVVTIVWSLVSPRGKALRALQNAEKFAYRYTQLPDDAPAEERKAAAEKMD